MATKIEIIGEALVITDTDTNKVILDVPKGDVYYFNEYLIDRGLIYIYDISVVNRYDSVLFKGDLANAIDTTDTPFTAESFMDFCRLNLGFKTASGGSGALSQFTIMSGLLVTKVIGYTTKTEWEIGDTFSGFFNNDRYVAGIVVGLPFDIDDNTKIQLAIDNLI